MRRWGRRFPAAEAAPPVAAPPVPRLPPPPGARACRVMPLRLVGRILVPITRLFLGNLDNLNIQGARWSSRTPRAGRRCSTSAHSTGSAPATSRSCRGSKVLFHRALREPPLEALQLAFAPGLRTVDLSTNAFSGAVPPVLLQLRDLCTRALARPSSTSTSGASACPTASCRCRARSCTSRAGSLTGSAACCGGCLGLCSSTSVGTGYPARSLGRCSRSGSATCNCSRHAYIRGTAFSFLNHQNLLRGETMGWKMVWLK